MPILENPYLFNGFVGHTDQPNLWQLVDENERYAITVFLPEIAESDKLLDDLSIQPGIITPPTATASAMRPRSALPR